VGKPRVVPDEDHEVVYERVAAVDVAKASGVVCLRAPDPARPGRFASRIWDRVPATREPRAAPRARTRTADRHHTRNRAATQSVTAPQGR
jgi:hypothetical protein